MATRTPVRQRRRAQPDNTIRLRRIMDKYQLTGEQVGKLLDRKPYTVYRWMMTGPSGRLIPDEYLELLEFRLQKRGLKTLPKSKAAAAY